MGALVPLARLPRLLESRDGFGGKAPLFLGATQLRERLGPVRREIGGPDRLVAGRAHARLEKLVHLAKGAPGPRDLLERGMVTSPRFREAPFDLGNVERGRRRRLVGGPVGEGRLELDPCLVPLANGPVHVPRRVRRPPLRRRPVRSRRSEGLKVAGMLLQPSSGLDARLFRLVPPRARRR